MKKILLTIALMLSLTSCITIEVNDPDSGSKTTSKQTSKEGGKKNKSSKGKASKDEKGSNFLFWFQDDKQTNTEVRKTNNTFINNDLRGNDDDDYDSYEDEEDYDDSYYEEDDESYDDDSYNEDEDDTFYNDEEEYYEDDEEYYDDDYYDEDDVITVYSMILESELPYIYYTSYNGSYVEKYIDEVASGNIEFALYDHPDFIDPILIINNNGLYSIIQYLGDGDYNTFSELEPSQSSMTLDGIYEDDYGNLYCIMDDYHGIYELNKVGDRLYLNYGYTEGEEGFASMPFEDWLNEDDIADIRAEFADGVESFMPVLIYPDTSEYLDPADYDYIRDNIYRIPMIKYDFDTFYDEASYF